MSNHFWNTLSTTDFDALDRESVIAVMPIGATEQHGPHLPVGTDAMILDEIIRRICTEVMEPELVILPTLWCSKSIEHDAIPGTLSLQTETLIAVLHDVTASIASAGFKRLLVINWHGGNSDLLSSLVRDLRQRHGLMVFLIDGMWLFPNQASVETSQDPSYDLHAGQLETSIMLAAYPDLVKPGPYDGVGSAAQYDKLADSFKGFRLLQPEGGPVRLAWLTPDLTEDGVIGDPNKAHAAEGEETLRTIVQQVQAILREIATFRFKP